MVLGAWTKKLMRLLSRSIEGLNLPGSSLWDKYNQHLAATYYNKAMHVSHIISYILTYKHAIISTLATLELACVFFLLFFRRLRLDQSMFCIFIFTLNNASSPRSPQYTVTVCFKYIISYFTCVQFSSVLVMTNLICSFHGTYHLPPYCSVLLQCKFWGNWNFFLCILSSHEAIILLIPNWGKGLGNLAEKSESENLNLLYHEKLLIGIDVCRENTTLVPLSLINDDAFCFK